MDLPTLEGLFQAARKTGSGPRPHAHDAGRAGAGGGAAGGPRRRDRRPPDELQPEDLQVGQDPPGLLPQPRDVPRPRALGRHPRLRLAALDPRRRVHRGARARGDDGAPGLPGLRQPGGLRVDDAERRRGRGHARLSAPGSRAHARGRTPADRRFTGRHRDRAGRAEGDAQHRRQARPGPCRSSPQTDIFTQFARSLRGEAPPPLTLHEACRITEIAIKAQQAADTGRVVSLRDSPYRTP